MCLFHPGIIETEIKDALKSLSVKNRTNNIFKVMKSGTILGTSHHFHLKSVHHQKSFFW